MTAYSSTPDLANHRLRVAFTIEGVPYVFTEGPISDGGTAGGGGGGSGGFDSGFSSGFDVGGGGGGGTTNDLFLDVQGNERPHVQCIERDSISFGENRIDLEKRRELGATLSLRIHDDTAGTLAALIKPRAEPVTFIDSTIARTTAMVGSGAISVDDESAFSAGDTAYIGAESFYVGSVATPGLLSNCYRQYYDGHAPQRHLGGTVAETAANVYKHPPAWTGRRLYLYAGLEGDDGLVEDVQLIGTWVLSGCPQPLNASTWDINAESLAAALAERVCYLGMQDVQPDEATVADATTIALSTDSGKLMHASGLAFRSHFMLQLADGWQSLRPGTSAAFSVTVDSQDFLTPAAPQAREVINGFTASVPPQILSLRQVFYAQQANPAKVALLLLCSYLGDGTEGTYDALAGREPSTWGDPEWYFGARLSETADVNVASFLKFRAAAPTWTVYIDEPITVGELLGELCQAVGAFWFVNASGQIELKRYSDRGDIQAGTAETITTADLDPSSPDAVDVIETDIFHTATFRANYDPIAGEFTGLVNVYDHNIQQRFPNTARVLEFESRFASVTMSRAPTRQGGAQRLVRCAGSTDEQIEHFLRRKQRRTARPRLEMSVTCRWHKSLIELGDEVTVTNANASDGEGGTINGYSALVIGKRADFARGTVEFRLMLRERGFYIAPAVEISSWVDGTKTATLKTDSDWIPSARRSAPAREFAAGWDGYLHHLSGTGSPTVAPCSVASIGSDTTLVLDQNAATLGFTPVSGDIIVLTGISGNANQAGYADTNHAFQTQDTPSGTPSRWL